MIDYDYLYNFFQFKGRKPFEYAERTISGEEFKKFADAVPKTDGNFNIFVEDTAEYPLSFRPDNQTAEKNKA